MVPRDSGEDFLNGSTKEVSVVGFGGGVATGEAGDFV